MASLARPASNSTPSVTPPVPVVTPASTPSATPAPSVTPPVPVVTPTPTVTPAPASAPASKIPTEDDINSVLALLGIYQKQSGVIKSLHEIASTNDVQTANLPTEDTVRSLLNLLELHKREADLIVSLRSSITSLQASFSSLQATLGKWDKDVAPLLKQKNAGFLNQKNRHRSLDYEKVKDFIKKDQRTN